jgi:hypothetical protein
MAAPQDRPVVAAMREQRGLERFRARMPGEPHRRRGIGALDQDIGVRYLSVSRLHTLSTPNNLRSFTAFQAHDLLLACLNSNVSAGVAEEPAPANAQFRGATSSQTAPELGYSSRTAALSARVSISTVTIKAKRARHLEVG